VTTVDEPPIDEQPLTVADIETVLEARERSLLSSIFHSQELWILFAVVVIGASVGFIAPNFLSSVNISNISTNFCFIALIAIGMTPVIMTGGIHISVGSTLGLCGVMVGLTYASGQPFGIGVVVVLLVGALVGLINGIFIAYMKLAPFIVTLAMMSMVRALTLVVTNNQVVYDFGPAQDTLLAFGLSRANSESLSKWESSYSLRMRDVPSSLNVHCASSAS
jgi:ribose transport system permease protein